MLLHKSSGSKGGGNTTMVVPTPSSEPKQMVTIPNNRDGYVSSAYALG